MRTLRPKDISDFIDWLYDQQAEKYGGDTTLNELRVVAHCYKAHTDGAATSLTKISQNLDMPTSTVHRAVVSLINKGWLYDRPHAEDGRKKLIGLSEQAIRGGLWNSAADFLMARTRET